MTVRRAGASVGRRRRSTAAALCLLSLWGHSASSQAVGSADAVVLRGLDRLSGDTTDLEIGRGETERLGSLAITLSDCRFPADNPAGDAFAFLTIDDARSGAPLFSGWMVASSPALNPLDHRRYDVWVMRCKSS